MRRDLLSLRLFCLRVGIIHIDEIIYCKILYTALNFFSCIFMSNQPKIFEEVKLQPYDDGIGKKCYATAKITHEFGTFPNKRYFTTNRPRYLGLYTRNEELDNAYRLYFHNPFIKEDTYFEIKNPLAQWKSLDSTPVQKDGFVEVVCQGIKIRSLQDLSRGTIKNYLDSLSNNEKEEFNTTLNENQSMHEIISPLTASVKGGKRRKKTRKGTKRKVRKRGKKTKRRRQ